MGKNNYINNEEFYNLMVEYKEKRDTALEKDLPPPKLPDKVGEAFLLIANRLGTKPNFSGYSYLDEMKGDAIENCIMAANNFDPEKSKNPFSYFTQIIWYAFLRRMAKEKKQTYIKYKSLEHAVTFETLYHGESSEIDMSFIDLDNEKMKPIIEQFEKSLTKKKKSANVGVEKFCKEK